MAKRNYREGIVLKDSLFEAVDKYVKGKTNEVDIPYLGLDFGEIQYQLIKTVLNDSKSPIKNEDIPANIVLKDLCVVLFSGGMDSLIVEEYVKETQSGMKTILLHVNVGTPYSDAEEAIVRKLRPEAIFLDWKIEQTPGWSHILPARNLLLCELAAELGGNNIWIGAMNGEAGKSNGDKSDQFFELAGSFLSKKHHRKISISNMKSHTKNWWLKWYVEKKGYSEIVKTITCYSEEAKEQGCGKCRACVRRAIAYEFAGIPIENNFQNDPRTHGKEIIQEYLENYNKALKNNDHSLYTKTRILEDLPILQKFIKQC